MKQVLVLFTLIGFLILSGCQTKTKSTSTFTKKVYTPEYATGFDIVGAENTESTIIHVRNPWQGAQDVEMSYFVARNGEQVPTDFNGVVIPAGAKRIVCMSSSYIAMLDALHQVDGWWVFPVLILSPTRTSTNTKRQSRIWAQR